MPPSLPSQIGLLIASLPELKLERFRSSRQPNMCRNERSEFRTQDSAQGFFRPSGVDPRLRRRMTRAHDSSLPTRVIAKRSAACWTWHNLVTQGAAWWQLQIFGNFLPDLQPRASKPGSTTTCRAAFSLSRCLRFRGHGNWGSWSEPGSYLWAPCASVISAIFSDNCAAELSALRRFRHSIQLPAKIHPHLQGAAKHEPPHARPVQL